MLRGGGNKLKKSTELSLKVYSALSVLGCSRLWAKGVEKDGNFGYLEFTLLEKRFKMSFNN